MTKLGEAFTLPDRVIARWFFPTVVLCWKQSPRPVYGGECFVRPFTSVSNKTLAQHSLLYATTEF
jgi:hypothetical protein